MPEQINFIVTGAEQLHCVGCETRIQFALQRLTGVQHVVPDFRTQCVAVQFDPAQVSVHQVRQRLEEIGFEVEVSS